MIQNLDNIAQFSIFLFCYNDGMRGSNVEVGLRVSQFSSLILQILLIQRAF